MTSDCQSDSNRENGRRGCGPRTAAGKARSRRNALQHGLAAGILIEPALRDAVERLARAIAGNDADLVRLNQARDIAEAQLDLARVQRIKVALLNSQFVDGLPARDLGAVGANFEAACLKSPAADASNEAEPPANPAPAPSLEILAQLARLERYERRAISRGRRAMRAFLTRRGG
jgi:hypothetical protein